MDSISKEPFSEVQRPASLLGVSEKNAKDVDAAAIFLSSVDAPPVFSAKQEQKLKRKIDLIMIPLVSSNYTGKQARQNCQPTINMLTVFTTAPNHSHTWSRRQGSTEHCKHLRECHYYPAWDVTDI